MQTTTDDGARFVRSNLLVPSVSYASVPEGFLGESLFSRGLYMDLIGSQSLLGSRADFLRAHVQFERVFDLVPQWHLLVRGEAGASLVRNFNELPGIFRFFAGGDRSVRGFAYNSLAPTEKLDLRTCDPARPDPGLCSVDRTVGGRNLLFGSVEIARDLPRNLAIATFFDIGNAFNRFGDPLEYSVGVGLRYRLPVVTLGIDVAKPLSTSGSPRLHLNISPKLRKRRLGFIVLSIALGVLVLLPTAAVLYLATTESGLRIIASRIRKIGPVEIIATGVSGTLTGGFRVEALSIDNPWIHLDIQKGYGRIEVLPLLWQNIDAPELGVQNVFLQIKPPPPRRPGPKRALRFMPGTLRVNADRIVAASGTLRLASGLQWDATTLSTAAIVRSREIRCSAARWSCPTFACRPTGGCSPAIRSA